MMTDQMPPGEGRQPTEEELAAAYAAELKRLRVEDVLLQTIVSLLNLAGRKAGMTPDTEDERDPGQLKLAIEGARALVPLIEEQLGPDAKQLRDALAQLQMAYVKISGGAPEGAEPGAEGAAPKPQDPPDAVSSGRLWVPGQ